MGNNFGGNNCHCEKEKCDCCCVPGIKDQLDVGEDVGIMVGSNDIIYVGNVRNVNCDIVTLGPPDDTTPTNPTSPPSPLRNIVTRARFSLCEISAVFRVS